MQSGTTATLSGLTAGTPYTYKAYSDSGCTTANLLATAAAFTTGSASNGYTLLSATVDFSTVVNGSGITASIRSKASNQPGSTDLATLTGTPAGGQQTFTCSGSGWNLSASTTYYVYLVGAAGSVANLPSTVSDNETLAPSTNGWSIANAARYEQGAWAEHPNSVSMKVGLAAARLFEVGYNGVRRTGRAAGRRGA